MKGSFKSFKRQQNRGDRRRKMTKAGTGRDLIALRVEVEAKDLLDMALKHQDALARPHVPDPAQRQHNRGDSRQKMLPKSSLRPLPEGRLRVPFLFQKARRRAGWLSSHARSVFGEQTPVQLRASDLPLATAARLPTAGLPTAGLPTITCRRSRARRSRPASHQPDMRMSTPHCCGLPASARTSGSQGPTFATSCPCCPHRTQQPRCFVSVHVLDGER